MVGTARVGRPSPHLHLPSSVPQGSQLVARPVIGVRVDAGVTDVQLAVGADPGRRGGRVRLRGGRADGRVDLAVDGESPHLAVPLHDALEGAGRRQGGHATVDGDDAGTRRAADDRLGGRTRLIGRRAETATQTSGPRNDAGVGLAHDAQSVATVMFATRVRRRRGHRRGVISPARRRRSPPDQRRQRGHRGRYGPR